jgi:hypothetical protein
MALSEAQGMCADCRGGALATSMIADLRVLDFEHRVSTCMLILTVEVDWVECSMYHREVKKRVTWLT